VAVERPRRSPLLIVWMLLLGVVLGASCVTCARTSFELQQDRVYGQGSERVGVVELEGPIMEVDEVVRHIRAFARRDDLQGLVVRIESPGGAVAPSQEVFEALRYASERKPVVTSMGSVAASGGFWVAMGADWVVAQPGSIAGSIGVITQSPDLRGLADKVDFRLRIFKSGPVKDLGNPLRELTDLDEAVFMNVIDDVFEQFVDTIVERRALDRDAVLEVADGRIFTGRRAKALGFVDELGGLHHAARRAVWLQRRRAGDIATDTSTATIEEQEDPVLVYPRAPGPEFLRLLTEAAAEALGRGWASAWSNLGAPPVVAR
jgi:protease-4